MFLGQSKILFDIVGGGGSPLPYNQIRGVGDNSMNNYKCTPILKYLISKAIKGQTNGELKILVQYLNQNSRLKRVCVSTQNKGCQV